jgi:hypothetical protein
LRPFTKDNCRKLGIHRRGKPLRQLICGNMLVVLGNNSWYIQFGKHMSLVVKLEDDLGEHSDWIILHGVLPSRDERSFTCLRGIDPYGKTVFNHLQMEGFLEEWERVKDRAHDDSQKEAWQKVREMAQSCQQDRDLFLRFVGN